MTILPKVELEKLSEKQKGFCVSMYVPSQQASSNVISMSTRLRSSIQKAEEILVGMGLKAKEATTLLKPARLLIQLEAGKPDRNGLVIFVARDTFRYYRLPFQNEELIFVADRFEIQPLMPTVAFEQSLALQCN